MYHYFQVERQERRGFEQRERQFTPRAPTELPTKPPYTAHVASLSFDATEDDLAGLFADLKVRRKGNKKRKRW